MVAQNHMQLMSIARNLERMSAKIRLFSKDNNETPNATQILEVITELHNQAETLGSLEEGSFQQVQNSKVTDVQREEAEDLGLMLCESCGMSYLPEPNFVNNGHKCDGTGMNPENIIPDSSEATLA